MRVRSAVVLDTMVLAEAALNPSGGSASIVKAAEDGRFQLVTSFHQLLELERTLSKPKLAGKTTLSGRDIFLTALGDVARVARDFPSPMPLTKDVGDNFVLQIARTTGAVVVTKDKGILDNHPESIPVFRPGDFARLLNGEAPEVRTPAILVPDQRKAAFVFHL